MGASFRSGCSIFRRIGNINLHGSLLPKYRGAAPIQWAIANGENITGVTTMRLDAGLDTGDMLLAQAVPIGQEETAVDVYECLAAVGAELMVETLVRTCRQIHLPPAAGPFAGYAWRRF